MRATIDTKGLPVALDCERMILATAMLNPEVLHEIRPLIVLDDFTTEQHRHIWQALTELYDAGKSTDHISVYQAAEKRNYGLTLSCLLELEEGMPRLSSISSYVEIVKDKTLLRQIIFTCGSVAQRAIEGTERPQAILESFGSLAVDLIPKDGAGGLQSAGELVSEVGIERLLAPRKERGLQFPWGWLNYWTCGMLPAELWILAGQTSAGKTSAMLQHAVNVAMHGLGVAIFSLEVGKEALFQKACYQLAMVDSEKGRSGQLSSEERIKLRDAATALNNSPIYFDTTATTTQAIHASVRRRKLKSRVDHVIVDYLQLLGNSGNHNNRAQAVGANAWALKMLATDFQVPVLLLSQFSRQKEGAGKRKPELSDLKESGDIENHANGVWFISREDQPDSDTIAVDFMLPKQRDGRRNITHPMLFLPRYQRFEERGDERDF